MNIGEIARRAGVSRSTVSYVLSGKRTVSEGTCSWASSPASSRRPPATTSTCCCPRPGATTTGRSSRPA
ncbi:LacI family DNA-binding transcriptional regulator [Micromonospora sp. NPDC049275]|uniref:LacI family DNA-binding transcriptional regulator n=1 Tax=Micromonospora sp. NPDC049275 TaxID=3364268 RepID=UPI003721E2A9